MLGSRMSMSAAMPPAMSNVQSDQLARHQNLVKIHQLQQNLAAAQQQELQYQKIEVSDIFYIMYLFD